MSYCTASCLETANHHLALKSTLCVLNQAFQNSPSDRADFGQLLNLLILHYYVNKLLIYGYKLTATKRKINY